MIVVDDAGISDIGYSIKLFNSSSKIKTPYIDSLANDGIIFKNYYTHPSCTPSRVALMTGRYAFMVGLPVVGIGRTNIIGINSKQHVLPKELKKRGYSTHMVGKWHLGRAKKSFTPTGKGFDTFFGLQEGAFDHYTKKLGKCYDLHRHYNNGTIIHYNKSNINESEHATELFTNEAISIVNNHDFDHNPLFLYLSYSAVHDPLQADQQYINKCHNVINKQRRIFCAMMEQLDANINRFVENLKRKGVWNDTILVFTTDNGGMVTVGGNNYPLKGQKVDSWEGGVRGPAFIHGGKQIKHSKNIQEGMVHIADWMPTLLSIVDKSNNNFFNMSNYIVDNIPMDGIDLLDSSNQLIKNIRKNTILTFDLFLDTLAYRHGCHKLIIGYTGNPYNFDEPDHRIFKRHPDITNFFDYIIEQLYQYIDIIFGTEGPGPGLLKVILTLDISQLKDWQQNDSYNFRIFNEQKDPFLDVKKHIPILTYDLNKGTRAQLYNICEDIEERKNLINEDHFKILAIKYFNEIKNNYLFNAPIQISGDANTEDGLFKGSCNEPFLEEDVIVEELEIKMRAFSVLYSRIHMAFLFAFVVVVIICTILCCCGYKIFKQCFNKNKKIKID